MRDQGYSVGIDLGGTSVRLGMFSPDLTLLGSIAMPTRVADGPTAVIADMTSALRSLEVQHGRRMDIVGLGSPGPLDVEEGRLCSLPNFPGWDGFPLRDAAEAAFGARVILQNDANAAALAEWRLGAGRELGVNSLCMITLGTGVGSGLILDGKIWSGSFGLGGEVGHVSVDLNGGMCSCGTVGCLELYASATGIVRMAKERGLGPLLAQNLSVDDTQEISAKLIAELAIAGNRSACDVFDRVGQAIGVALASIANSLDLPLYILGGGVAASWDLFAPKMFETLQTLSNVYRLRQSLAANRPELSVHIVPACCGSDAGLLGAALLTRQEVAQESMR